MKTGKHTSQETMARHTGFTTIENTNTMKKRSNTVSPFLLLLLPLFVALSLAWTMGIDDTEIVREQLAHNASFITLPEINIFQVLLWWK